MNELALHIYDIVQNSVRANATNVWITICEEFEKNELKIIIRDDGSGMSKEVAHQVRDPFYTTRTTRSVGLGISLLEMAANQCNGFLSLDTELGVGTTLTVVFEHNHINRSPLGDMAETIYLLSLGEVNIIYNHTINGKSFNYTKSDVLEVLGDVPLTNIDVKVWLEDYIKQNLESLVETQKNKE
jgi:anti-sigma regulatory factor (Ser/Thr protein kinase)